jgi:uncharacterized membrane protein YfcA
MDPAALPFELSALLPLIGATFAAGLVAGTLAGLLGVGGGIVVVPALVQAFTLLDVDPAVRMHLAVGTSLATIVPTGLRSALAHDRRGAVDRRLLRAWGPWILLGVLAGSALSGAVAGGVLSAVFAATALIVALYMATAGDRLRLGQYPPGTPWRQPIAGGVGTVSAMMGIGGGTLCVPLFTLFGVEIRRAVGTAAAIGLIIAVPGSLGFAAAGWSAPGLPPLSLGYVSLPAFAVIVPATVLAAPLGARLAHSIPRRTLRLAFAAFLLVTALRMLYELSLG